MTAVCVPGHNRELLQTGERGVVFGLQPSPAGLEQPSPAGLGLQPSSAGLGGSWAFRSLCPPTSLSNGPRFHLVVREHHTPHLKAAERDIAVSLVVQSDAGLS